MHFLSSGVKSVTLDRRTTEEVVVGASFNRHHIPEDILDEFVMEMLSEQDCAFWEEHLLICPTCQDRVAEADEYVRVVKSAAAQFRTHRGLSKPVLAAATHA
jgi:hypothetical protein